MNTGNNNKPQTGSIVMMIITAVLCIADILCYWLLIDTFSPFYLVIFTIANAILMVGMLFFHFFNKKGWFKLAFIAIIVVAIFSWGYYVLEASGLLEIFNSKEALQDAIASTGAWGMLVYTLLQFLQVTFIPLPAMLTTIVGTILFGPLLATVLSFIGIMSGAIFAFWLGDKFGEKLVVWIAGKEQTEKYSKMLFEKGKYVFFLMMLFPLFPDDILCLVAGMTTMSFRFFLTTIFLTRPIGIIMTCYLGSGEIIPFHGWGLIVWGILILAMAILFICSYKYQAKIEEFLGKLAGKFSSKKRKLKPVVTEQKVLENVNTEQENKTADETEEDYSSIKTAMNRVDDNK